MPDLGEFRDITSWAHLCSDLYRQWVRCRRRIPVSPDRDYAEEASSEELEKRAQSFLIAAGISPYGLEMKDG